MLVFDDELQLAAQRSQEAAAAVIVQDVDAVELIREVAPGLAVHGSTPMSVTSAEGFEFAAAVRRAGLQTLLCLHGGSLFAASKGRSTFAILGSLGQLWNTPSCTCTRPASLCQGTHVESPCAAICLICRLQLGC